MAALGLCGSCESNPGADQTTGTRVLERGGLGPLPNLTLERFVYGVKANEPTTVFYELKYATLE